MLSGPPGRDHASGAAVGAEQRLLYTNRCVGRNDCTLTLMPCQGPLATVVTRLLAASTHTRMLPTPVETSTVALER